MTIAPDWKCAWSIYRDVAYPKDWDRQTLALKPHTVGEIIKACEVGETIPRLRASEHATRKVRRLFASGPVVTITERAIYIPERNTDPVAWGVLLNHVESAGFHIMKVRDTDAALNEGYGFAELNLDLRLACYQEAKLNLLPVCGPASLCYFLPTPYLMFGAGVPADEWQGNMIDQGLPLGASWPWATPEQRIVYGKPSAESMIAAFDAWYANAAIKGERKLA